MTLPEVSTIPVQHCDLAAKVSVGGTGTPVLYLHPAAGPKWDGLVAGLAERHTVYAPDHPGTGNTDRYDIHKLDSLWDLVLFYDELLDGLGLDTVQIVGSSFGGMMACELAAFRPERVSKMALIAPIGLWRDDAPVTPYMMQSAEKQLETLFVNPSSPEVQEFLKMPEDEGLAAEALADMIWAFGSTGKFVWPIPDKGLDKRMHRITAPSLVVWGERDALISSIYAQEFANRLPDARVEIIPGAGHVPQVENLDVLLPLVLDYLDEG